MDELIIRFIVSMTIVLSVLFGILVLLRSTKYSIGNILPNLKAKVVSENLVQKRQRLSPFSTLYVLKIDNEDVYFVESTKSITVLKSPPSTHINTESTY